ncbi:MAG: hypothetical protein FWD69_14425 [Polyangiaceae bacterium]|nr:hypothetical protein [Polyangiaceae bacterium]
MKELLREDRGLGTAYERHCLYQLIDAWAREFEIESLLEGPVDGMAGVAGVHGVGLAMQGIKVVSAVPTAEHAEITRAVYASCNAAAHVNVVVADETSLTTLPQSDMVICYHALSFVNHWQNYLADIAKLARKALVVAVCNPDNWGVTVMKSLARLKGHRNAGPPQEWHTEDLAPELWRIGRVKQHTYFDCPWWPDLPAFDRADAYAGRSVKGRLKKMLIRRSGDASRLADKFVYGPDRWPYFGGPGWRDELMPALLKHPCFEGAPGKIQKRTAHLHAFVVDVRPRTPQKRRRLATVKVP